ncbi:MAG: hypothetical protein JJ863_12300 [Deltaproteobacteria bacterium]|nr:hypothetical protein [Deltaproteobacteria bacterium]
MDGPFYAAAIVGSIAPFVRSLAWGVPMWMFTWGMALRATLGAGLVTLMAGLIPLVVVDHWTAGAIGLGVGGLLMLLSARRLRHLRGVMLLSWRLGSIATRDDAAKRLVKRLASARKLGAIQYAPVALIAAGPLSAVERWDDVLTALDGLTTSPLPKALAERVAQARATAQLAVGDLEGAAESLESVDRPAEEGIERWLRATEALLHAVQGGADQALAIANEASDADAALGASYEIVRAHALASKGDDEGAKACLRKVEDVAGATGLQRAVKPVGPATDIARAMLKAVLQAETAETAAAAEA